MKLETLPLPKPDKTKITNGISQNFLAHTVESTVFASLDELPEEVKALVDTEEQKKFTFNTTIHLHFFHYQKN